MRDILQNKNFVKLWIAQAISIFGDQIHFIALMVLIQNFFGDILVTGTVMLVAALPKVIFGPFVGVLIDRWSLKKTMVISDILRAILVLSIPFLFYVLETTSMTVILIITFLISTISVFFYPAKSASIPTLVAKDKLLTANSISATTQTSISLLGLLGAAVLVAVIGTTWAFIIDTASFIASALAVSLIKYPKKETKTKEKLDAKLYMSELKIGLKYIINDKVLRFMLSFFISLMLIGGAINISYFAYIDQVLKEDASIIGYIYGANMIGMLIGVTLIPKIVKKYPKEKLLVWSTLIFAFTVSSIAWVDTLTLVIPIMVINGLGNGILNVVSNTIFQENVKETMRGRVFSVIDALVSSAAIISMLPAAWLAQKFGVTNVFTAAGILIFFLFIISFKRVNKLFPENPHTKVETT